MRVVLSVVLLLWSHVSSLEADPGCCSLIEVTSSGQAAQQQPQRLGVYLAQAGLSSFSNFDRQNDNI